MQRLLFFLILASLLLLGGVFWVRSVYPEPALFYPEPERKGMWPIQAIDTMKYSRDLAREKLADKSFDAVIERQVKAIAQTGATHVAIATPYDEEFFPFLEHWVKVAREEGLAIWFRGNWSGWEGWFDYAKITRADHLEKTKAFILTHPDLFKDGDIFVTCPECENGGTGDPRAVGDVEGYRAFLLASERGADEAFHKLGKKVETHLFSMNGDVARLVMDKKTTEALGNTITVDHYVKTPEQLLQDVRGYAKGGHSVILGEIGVPIPNIHGNMTENEQAEWLSSALDKLSTEPSVRGVNYWLSVGGSTELWLQDGKPKKIVAALTRYFAPSLTYGFIRDGLGQPLQDAEVRIDQWSTKTDKNGYFALQYIPREKMMSASVMRKGYDSLSVFVIESRETFSLVMHPTEPTLFYRGVEFLRRLFVR